MGRVEGAAVGRMPAASSAASNLRQILDVGSCLSFFRWYRCVLEMPIFLHRSDLLHINNERRCSKRLKNSDEM